MCDQFPLKGAASKNVRIAYLSQENSGTGPSKVATWHLCKGPFQATSNFQFPSASSVPMPRNLPALVAPMAASIIWASILLAYGTSWIGRLIYWWLLCTYQDLSYWWENTHRNVNFDTTFVIPLFHLIILQFSHRSITPKNTANSAYSLTIHINPKSRIQSRRSKLTQYLVGGIPTPLKNMTSSLGMVIPFQTEWKNNPFMFQSPQTRLSSVYQPWFIDINGDINGDIDGDYY